MKPSRYLKLAAFGLIGWSFSWNVLAGDDTSAQVGQKPSTVVISGSEGGSVSDASPWSSDSLTDKLNLVVYVDPDLSDLNDDFTKAVKAKAFPKDKFGSVAVINMQATWKPNVIIQAVLKKKQKDYPNTIYVTDKAKVLVKKWKLTDDAYNVLLFDTDGKLLFKADGKLDDLETARFINLVEDALTKGEKSAEK